jgi:hypothetical protein
LVKCVAIQAIEALGHDTPHVLNSWRSKLAPHRARNLICHFRSLALAAQQNCMAVCANSCAL